MTAAQSLKAKDCWEGAPIPLTSAAEDGRAADWLHLWGVANSEIQQNPPGVKLNSRLLSLMGRILVSYRCGRRCVLGPGISASGRGHCMALLYHREIIEDFLESVSYMSSGLGGTCL